MAVAALKPKAGITPLGRGAYRAAACGAIMTRNRAALGGYEVTDECPLCGKPRDTVHHRVYGCDESNEALEGAVPAWFIEEARRADPRDPFWTSGVFPHPADIVPPPATGVTIVYDNGPNGEGDAYGGAGQQFGGHVYFDGSCKPHPIKDLSRAGGGRSS